MSKQTDRQVFIATLARELPDLAPRLVQDLARRLLRHAATLHRLAEAQCNGDWPADHGDAWKTEECTKCGGYWHPSALKPSRLINRGEDGRYCPDCRTSAQVVELLKPFNITPIINGDPRGAVLKLKVPSGNTDDWGRIGICVPK